MKVDKKINDVIAKISAVEDNLPCIVIIHNIQKGFTVEYMSERGLQILNTSNEELREIGLNYYELYFNAEDAKDYVPKMSEMIARNDMDEIFTFFQQVRRSTNHAWEWYVSSTKLLMRDEDRNPLLTITQAVPIDPLKHITKKVERLLEENTLMHKNLEKYASLTRQEKEVLRRLVHVKSNKEIADELFISVSTIESHKKNIKQKLGIKSATELNLFARAFDLV